MGNFYARSVFFTSDAVASLRFYTEQLGFSVDWNVQEKISTSANPSGEVRTTVFQVSLFGFEVILNQAGDQTRGRPGHGRVFIGLEDDQGESLRQHVTARRIQTQRVEWGRPTLVIKDLDGNELFFWLPHDDFTGVETKIAE